MSDSCADLYYNQFARDFEPWHLWWRRALTQITCFCCLLKTNERRRPGWVFGVWWSRSKYIHECCSSSVKKLCSKIVCFYLKGNLLSYFLNRHSWGQKYDKWWFPSKRKRFTGHSRTIQIYFNHWHLKMILLCLKELNDILFMLNCYYKTPKKYHLIFKKSFVKIKNKNYNFEKHFLSLQCCF